jgi:hypothetical protein
MFGDFFPSIHPGLHSHAERGNEKRMGIHEFAFGRPPPALLMPETCALECGLEPRPVGRAAARTRRLEPWMHMPPMLHWYLSLIIAPMKK